MLLHECINLGSILQYVYIMRMSIAKPLKSIYTCTARHKSLFLYNYLIQYISSRTQILRHWRPSSSCEICIRQTDLKSLIAYSSVAHMGIVIGGIITISYWGFCGSFTLIIAHGLCSSGLFCLANISYERLDSRRLLISRGMNKIPVCLCCYCFSEYCYFPSGGRLWTNRKLRKDEMRRTCDMNE
jgi:hypothetical protein